MFLTVARMVADDTNPDSSGTGVEAAILLGLLLAVGFWFYRRTTQGSRKLADDIRKRGIEPAVPVAPPPVLFGDREAAIGAGVDLTAVLAAQPSFSALGLLSIARETFTLVRKARAEQIPKLADGLLSPDLRAQLEANIGADAAAHRHHMFPMLDISTAAIVDSDVGGESIAITVRLALSGTEVERSDDSGAVVSGNQQARTWDERWTFRKSTDAAGDAAERDRIMTHTAGGWMIPHQGWIVTAIVTGESVPADLDTGTTPLPEPGANDAAAGPAPVPS